MLLLRHAGLARSHNLDTLESSLRCRGVNQRREVVIEFRRTFMVYRRDSEEGRNMGAFPGTDADWTV